MSALKTYLQNRHLCKGRIKSFCKAGPAYSTSFKRLPLKEADYALNTTRTLVVVLSALITARCGK